MSDVQPDASRRSFLRNGLTVLGGMSAFVAALTEVTTQLGAAGCAVTSPLVAGRPETTIAQHDLTDDLQDELHKRVANTLDATQRCILYSAGGIGAAAWLQPASDFTTSLSDHSWLPA